MCAAKRIALIVILAAAQIALFRPFPGIAFTATAVLPGPGRTGRRRQSLTAGAGHLLRPDLAEERRDDGEVPAGAADTGRQYPG